MVRDGATKGTPMTRILAFIDGSAYSASVCDHAAWVATREGAGVDLVHVLGRRDAAGEPANLSGNIGLGARTALLEELADLDARNAQVAQKRGRVILEEAKARLTEIGVADVTAKLRNGDIVEAVQDFEDGADLIVIGKRGEAADFATLHLGSNLERVVRASKRPMLVAARAYRPVERVLVAFDAGKSALKAIDHMAASPLFAGLAVTLLTVGAETAEARKRLAEAENKLAAAGLAVTTDIVEGEPETVIADRIAADGIDLLVMGAYGHSRIRSLIIGSTTSAMIRSCTVPVMLFR